MTATIRDAHTHFFSRAFFDGLAKLSPTGRPADELLAEVTARAGIELPSANHAALRARWTAQMDAAGIASMVTFASLPGEADVVATAVAASGGRLSGYVVVNPLADGAEAFVERALSELGLRGLVLFPAMHHYHVSDPACRPILDRVRAQRAVVVVHCGILHVKLRDLVSLPRDYDARYANPHSLVGAANRYPDVAFVIPHFGAGMLAETLLAGAWCDNIQVDSSSSNSWLRSQVPRLNLADVFARALEVFGPRRILFGTDSSTFPRGYRTDLLTAQLAALDSLGVSSDDRAAILGGNLERLLARG